MPRAAHPTDGRRLTGGLPARRLLTRLVWIRAHDPILSMQQPNRASRAAQGGSQAPEAPGNRPDAMGTVPRMMRLRRSKHEMARRPLAAVFSCPPACRAEGG